MAENLLSGRHGLLSAPSSRTGEPSSRNLKLSRIASRVVLAVAILGLIAATSLYGFRFKYDDNVYPGVNVSGVSLGGLSEADARSELEAEANRIESTRAYFDYGSQHWAPTLAELGVSVDVDTTLANAMQVGREADGNARLSSSIDTLRQTTTIPLEISVSTDALEAWALDVDDQLGIRPRNASLVVENGATVLTEEANGTVVDLESLQQIVDQSVRSLTAPTAPLPVEDFLPTVYAADLQNAKATLDQALAKSVAVKWDESTWEIPAAEFGSFVSIAVDQDSSGSEAVSIEIDKRGLANYLNDLVSDSVAKEPLNAKVAWNGDSLTIIRPAADGIRVLPSSLADNVSSSFLGGHTPVEVPVQVLAAEVNGSNLDSLGITTKLAAGSSNFDGSDDARSTNIMVGANLLNGTLIPPGGEFSFNHSVGIISAETGFVEAQVIDGERIGRDFGGGICQVSTTVFRAAMYAGLPITEWWPHRYRLGFYELDGWDPGMDASILQPEGDPFGGGDFKFVNPSDSWMLVESYVDYPRVYVIIYGPELGYSVDIYPSAPEILPAKTDAVEVVDWELPAGSIVQSEWAGQGMNVSNYRTVYDSDGNLVREDNWPVFFDARSDVWKVSPDMQGQSPGAYS